MNEIVVQLVFTPKRDDIDLEVADLLAALQQLAKNNIASEFYAGAWYRDTDPTRRYEYTDEEKEMYFPAFKYDSSLPDPRYNEYGLDEYVDDSHPWEDDPGEGKY